MIGAILSMAFQSGMIGPEICTVSFDTAQGRIDNIDIVCPELDDQSGAEAEIRRQLAAVGRVGSSRYPAENRVAVFRIDDHWYATSQPVSRTPPRYPARAAERGVSAGCAVRYHVSGGSVEYLDSACQPDGATRMFGRPSGDAIQNWRYTDGLPLFCDHTSLEYSVSPAYAEIESPPPPACAISDDQLAQLPEPIRPFAASLPDLLARPGKINFDPATGIAVCELSFGEAGLAVTCPENAPDQAALTAQFEALLDRGNYAVDSDAGVELGNGLAARLTAAGGWEIDRFQTVLTREPALSPEMMNRRSSAQCRAGIEVGPDGRAVSYRMACVTSVNPARNRGI